MVRCPFSLQQSEDVMNYGFPSEKRDTCQHKGDDTCAAEMPHTKPTTSVEKKKEASNLFVREGATKKK